MAALRRKAVIEMVASISPKVDIVGGEVTGGFAPLPNVAIYQSNVQASSNFGQVIG